MSYVNALGYDMATGIDAQPRPGENAGDYFKRIAQQQADYVKFLADKQAGVVVSRPLFPGDPERKPDPKPPKSDDLTMILVGGGILAIAFVLLRKPK